ncbi:HdeD family acid-resistance protein [Phenylobacterium sp.]|jgi:uncharacterized membrane protein HdeD (DUF308 family)|uniref:HdeD family acid-resistance protein n=1 Tax=Phenylobacterium sp. TaxID=1871053 RepID=UPI002F4024DD
MSRQPNVLRGPVLGRSTVSPAILAIALIVVGIFVLADAAMVARFSAALVGGAAIIVGGFELLHGISQRPWTRAAPRCVLGVIYLAFGLGLLRHEEVRTLVLTDALGLLLIVSGGIRVALGAGRAPGARWLLPSGLVGLAAGLSILFAWPGSGARWISLALGADLLVHGLAWAMVALARQNRGAG